MTSPLARPFELRAIELRPQRLALAAPLVTGRDTYHARRLTLLRVEVRTDCGITEGWGEVAALPGWSDDDPDALDAAARRIGCPAAFDGIAALDTVLPEAGRLRPLRFGLECALLDALCRAEQRSLAAVLAERRGAAPQDSVAVQVTLGDAPAAEMVESLHRARNQGFRCAKLKVGARRARADRSRIGEIVEARTGMRLRLDANGAWRVTEALAMLADLPGEAVELVEQPVADDAFDALLHRYDGAGPLIAADESCAVPGRAAQLLSMPRLGGLVVKPAAIGGLLRADALLDAAGGRGIVGIVSNLMESAVGRRAVAHLAAARSDLPGPHGLATGAWFAEDLAPPDVVVDGRLAVPAGSGLGLDPVAQ
jgi:o-succinylbenzoate synthase